MAKRGGRTRSGLACLVALVAVLATMGLAKAFCTSDEAWEHVSPILCPVAKIRMCWNVTDPGKEILLRVEAKVEGYMSVGLLSRSFSGLVDVMTLYVDDDGIARATDQYIASYQPSYAYSSSLQVAVDDQQDIDVVGGAVRAFDGTGTDGHVSGTYTAVTVRKTFASGDLAHDYTIANGVEAGVIWATSVTHKPSSDAPLTTWYPESYSNKGSWRVTFDNSENALTCDYYCGVQMNACGDSQEIEHQYSSEAECVSRCTKYLESGAWVAGDLQNDHAVNTLACRVNAAHQAENVPANDDALRQTLCDTSGPGGNGVCGTQCDNYCTHMALACGSTYASEQACLDACYGGFVGDAKTECVADDDASSLALGDGARYNASHFPFYDTSTCRGVHASLAYTFDTTGIPLWLETGSSYRCPLASSDSPSCCDAAEPTCAYYCESVLMSCTGPRAQFGSLGECMGWCASELSGALVAGSFSDTDGWSLGCLTRTAQQATSDETCDAAKLGGIDCMTPSQAAVVIGGEPPACGECGDGIFATDEDGTCVCVDSMAVELTFPAADVASFLVGIEAFRASLASQVGIDASRVHIVRVVSGSVIATVVITPPAEQTTLSTDDIAGLTAKVETLQFDAYAGFVTGVQVSVASQSTAGGDAPFASVVGAQAEAKSGSGGASLGLIVGVTTGMIVVLCVGLYVYSRVKTQSVFGCIYPQPPQEMRHVHLNMVSNSKTANGVPPGGFTAL